MIVETERLVRGGGARRADTAPPAAARAARAAARDRAGSAPAGSTTRPTGSRCRRPRPTAWPRSTSCSAPRPPDRRRPGHPRVRRRRLPHRRRRRSGRTGRSRRRPRPPQPVPRPVRAGARPVRARASATPDRRAGRRHRRRSRVPQAGDPGLRLLRRIGVVDPTSLDALPRARRLSSALARAVELGPDAVIEAVADLGLVGSGRGGLPHRREVAGRAPTQPGDRKHVVANCDESEPGTFKDRVLMEHDPVRPGRGADDRRPRHRRRRRAGSTSAASTRWRPSGSRPPSTRPGRPGSWAPDAAGSGHVLRHRAPPRRRRLHLRRGDGAVQLDRGLPGRAPQQAAVPTTHGLFGEPTAINNPETLLNVLPVLVDGADAYRSIGHGRLTGDPPVLPLRSRRPSPGSTRCRSARPSAR